VSGLESVCGLLALLVVLCDGKEREPIWKRQLHGFLMATWLFRPLDTVLSSSRLASITTFLPRRSSGYLNESFPEFPSTTRHRLGKRSSLSKLYHATCAGRQQVTSAARCCVLCSPKEHSLRAQPVAHPNPTCYA
jgi:hypothetical protein